MLLVLRGNLKFKYLFFQWILIFATILARGKSFWTTRIFCVVSRYPEARNTAFQHLKFVYELLCQRRVFLGACWLVWLKFDIDNSKDGRQWVLTYVKVINRPMTHIFVNTVSLFHVGAWTESTTRVESVIKEFCTQYSVAQNPSRNYLESCWWMTGL